MDTKSILEAFRPYFVKEIWQIFIEKYQFNKIVNENPLYACFSLSQHTYLYFWNRFSTTISN